MAKTANNPEEQGGGEMDGAFETRRKKQIEEEKKSGKKSPEGMGELIDLQERAKERKEKKEEEIKGERKKPTKETLDKQGDKIAETMAREIDEEEYALEKEQLAEQLDEGGIKLSVEEIKILQEAMPALVEGISPEFAAYLEGMSPRVTKVLQDTEKLTKEGNEYKAIELLSEFIAKETEGIENIKDPVTKEQIFSYINATIDIEKVVAKMKKQTKIDVATGVAECVPYVGPALEFGQAVRGKKASGRIMSGGERVAGAVIGTASLAGDIFLGGAASGAKAAAKAAKAGSGISKAAKIGYTTAKATKGAKQAMTAAKAAKMVHRFAAFTRKSGKLKRVSRIIFKVGTLIKKHPKLATFIGRRVASIRTGKRNRYDGTLGKVKAGKDAFGVARGKTKTTKRIEKNVTKIKKSPKPPEEELPKAA